MATLNLLNENDHLRFSITYKPFFFWSLKMIIIVGLRVTIADKRQVLLIILHYKRNQA